MDGFRLIQEVYESSDRCTGTPSVTSGDLLEVEVAGRLGQPFIAGRLFHDVGVASDFVFGDDASGRASASVISSQTP